MRLLAIDGQRSDALAQYATCRRVLQAELGVEPAPETRALYEQILRGQPLDGPAAGEAAARAAEGTVPIPGNGNNGKVVSHTATTSPEPPGRRRADVPSAATALIGRDGEMAQGLVLLQRPDVRLVTLVGPGGIGKTRLALELAARALDFSPDGVVFVDLVALSDPELLPSTIAQALDIKETSEAPVLKSLIAHLRRRQLLLVLDNFEQLVAAAPLIAQLLAAAPGLKLLLTSREPLHLDGEHRLPVPPLALPGAGRHTPAELEQYPFGSAVRGPGASGQGGFQSQRPECGSSSGYLCAPGRYPAGAGVGGGPRKRLERGADRGAARWAAAAANQRQPGGGAAAAYAAGLD